MINAAIIHDQILTTLTWVLPNWGGSESVEGNTSSGPTGADRVAESLTAIRAALKALGSRDRAGARAVLEAKRDTLAARLKLYHSLGRFLRGPAAVDLIDRCVAARASADAAREAMMMATRSTVAARRAELDLAEADEREIAARSTA